MVERLAWTAATQPGNTSPHRTLPISGAITDKSAKPKRPERLEDLAEFLESIVEPRAMTALATVPVAGGADGGILSEWVDPAMVRNWAEFVDPALALRWKVFASGKGFSQAVMLPGDEAARGVAAARNAHISARDRSSVSTTWRSAVMEGAGRALSGQQALQEWLVLPMADPKANPWLGHLQGYRY